MAGVALLAVGGGVGGYAGSRLIGSSSSNAPIQVSPQGNGSSDVQSAASKVKPAIVDINTTVASARGTAKAAGTGIILTSSGEVLTNNHVVEGATSIDVSIEGQSGSHSAKVLGVDPSKDVALIQIQGVSGLPTAKLADSSSLKVGQSVAVLGNACGQGQTAVTQGTVTGLNQSLTAQDDTGSAETLSGMVAVNADIVPGDSGGAVVNSAGQVVGMTTAGNGGDNACGNSGSGLQGSYGPPGSGTLPGGGSSGSGSSGGAEVPGGSGASGGSGQSDSTTGYAVPTNTAVGIVNQIRSGQTNSEILPGQTGFLGVEGQSLTQAAAEQRGLPVDSGVLVAGFADSSPARDAGIPQNAVITAIAGKAVTSTKTLQQQLAQHKPGDKVAVSWTDGSGSHSSTVTLGTGPAA